MRNKRYFLCIDTINKHGGIQEYMRSNECEYYEIQNWIKRGLTYNTIIKRNLNSLCWIEDNKVEKQKIYKYQLNHDLIYKEGIKNFSIKNNISRQTIYNWLKDGISEKQIIEKQLYKYTKNDESPILVPVTLNNN